MNPTKPPGAPPELGAEVPQGKRQLIGLLRPDASREEIQALCDLANLTRAENIAKQAAEPSALRGESASPSSPDSSQEGKPTTVLSLREWADRAAQQMADGINKIKPE